MAMPVSVTVNSSKTAPTAGRRPGSRTWGRSPPGSPASSPGSGPASRSRGRGPARRWTRSRPTGTGRTRPWRSWPRRRGRPCRPAARRAAPRWRRPSGSGSWLGPRRPARRMAAWTRPLRPSRWPEPVRRPPPSPCSSSAGVGSDRRGPQLRPLSTRFCHASSSMTARFSTSSKRTFFQRSPSVGEAP